MCHSSVSWKITLLYFLCWDFIWFKQKEPIKVENFRLLIAQVKFHQICTLIGFVCWKYIKVQLKGCRGVMPQNTEEWCKVRGKPDFLFKKWQDFGEFWPEHSKVSKICTLIVSFCAKYITFDLKKYRGVIFHDTEKLWKILRKSDLWFEKWHEEFHQNTCNPQNWDFDGILLLKVENAWSKIHRGVMSNDTHIDEKFEEELTCFKIIWWSLTQALESLKNLKFNGGILLTKVYNIWAKKVLRSYLSWHWKMMRNLKKN